ncbi:MAG: ribosomal protein S18-alanine N-acetyltransferase [Candidatus Caldarchaeum sp.]
MQQTEKASRPGALFRNVRIEDLIQVMNINRICLPENYTYGFFEDLARDFPKSFWVAEVDSKIVGYIMCRVERIFSKFDFLKIRKAGHIVSIAVLPEYRRRGLATELIKLALNSLTVEYGCEEAYLEVRVSNHAAISLYRKIGFTPREVQKRYYMDGEDALLMAVKLQPLS